MLLFNKFKKFVNSMDSNVEINHYTWFTCSVGDFARDRNEMPADSYGFELVNLKVFFYRNREYKDKDKINAWDNYAKQVLGEDTDLYNLLTGGGERIELKDGTTVGQGDIHDYGDLQKVLKLL